MQFDSTLSIGNLLTIVAFFSAAGVAWLKKDAKLGQLAVTLDRFEKLRSDDMEKVDHQFAAISEALKEQVEILRKNAVYDVKLKQQEQQIQDLGRDVRMLVLEKTGRKAG